MGVGLVRSLQPPDILWVHWRVYNSIANTSKEVLFLPPSDAYVRRFLYLVYTLLTLLHESSERSSFISGPGLNSSPLKAKHLSIFLSLATTFQQYGHSPRARHPGMWNQVGLREYTTNKASGSDGIPAKLFQILKDDTVKVQHSICQKIWITQQWPQDWKMSTFIPIPKKGNTKECSNYCTTLLILHASKAMLKFFKPSLNSMWTENFQMCTLNLEKAEEPKIKFPTSVES